MMGAKVVVLVGLALAVIGPRRLIEAVQAEVPRELVLLAIAVLGGLAFSLFVSPP